MMPGSTTKDTTTLIAIYGLGSLALYAGCKRSLSSNLNKRQIVNEQCKEKKELTDASLSDRSVAVEPEATDVPNRWRPTAGEVLVLLFGIMFGLGAMVSNGLMEIMVIIQIVTETAFTWYIVENCFKRLPPITPSSSASLALRSNGRRAASLVTALLATLGVYYDYQWLQCIPVSGLIYLTIASDIFPRWSIWKYIKFTVAAQLASFAIILCIFATLLGVSQATGSATGRHGYKGGSISPSDQRVKFGAMFSSALPILAPAPLLSLALRFDYETASRTANNDGPVRPTPTPVFSTGFWTLIVELGILVIADYCTSGMNREMFQIGGVLCLTATPVILGMMAMAQKLGVYEDFKAFADDDL